MTHDIAPLNAGQIHSNPIASENPNQTIKQLPNIIYCLLVSDPIKYPRYITILAAMNSFDQSFEMFDFVAAANFQWRASRISQDTCKVSSFHRKPKAQVPLQQSLPLKTQQPWFDSGRTHYIWDLLDPRMGASRGMGPELPGFGEACELLHVPHQQWQQWQQLGVSHTHTQIHMSSSF